MKCTAATLVLVGLLVFIAGCGEASTSSVDESTTVSVSTAATSVSTTLVVIPDDVTYTIINEDIVPGVKRSFDILLNRRVSENVLTAIAMELKNSDASTYDRTFICYYLPGMKVDAGCWATTHFDPDLEVVILGLTVEEEQALVEQPVDQSREVVGSWFNEIWGSVVTIYKEDGKVFMENKYGDGSADVDELVETSSPDGRRYDYQPDRGNGEYFLVNADGILQELDTDGVFLTLQKAD